MNEKSKILVVDNEESILRLFSRLFGSDYEIFTSDNGYQAIALLELHEISIIVTDIVMEGMDGTELCTIIRQNNPNCIIFGMTGYIRFAAPPIFPETDFDDYFPKPLDVESIRQSLKMAEAKLRSKQMNPEVEVAMF